MFPLGALKRPPPRKGQQNRSPSFKDRSPGRWEWTDLRSILTQLQLRLIRSDNAGPRAGKIGILWLGDLIRTRKSVPMEIETDTANGLEGNKSQRVELHYKTYQKVLIYRDKIQCSIINLGTLHSIMPFSQGRAPLMARIKELESLMASLTEFCSNSRFSLPYVPPSRCRALKAWYGEKSLFAPSDLANFQQNLLAADKELLLDVGRALKGESLPRALKQLLHRHLNRYKKLRRH